MDLVIPVRNGGRTESLRYALRSFAAHLPHDRVWLVGYKPPWARNICHIPTVQRDSKYANTTLAMRAACQHPAVSDEFLWAADDIFAMRTIAGRIGDHHRGPMIDLERYLDRKYKGRGGYIRGIRATRRLLEGMGFEKPLSYELHVPIVVSKAKMLPVLDLGKTVPAFHKRTAYAVINEIGGTRLRDPKVLGMGRFDRNAAFLSTMPNSFSRGAVGQHIRKSFPTPGPHEQAARGQRTTRRLVTARR